MNHNVGKIDSLVRFILGIAIMVAGVTYHTHWGFAGLAIFVTSFIQWCPVYKITGLNSRERPQTRSV